MKRNLFDQLVAWKNSKNRKPLILKGVRQVGKTYLLEKFGRECFRDYHRVNFEKNRRIAGIFTADLDPQRIVSELGVQTGKAIDITNDLIIFDEIQACPEALTSLKYFCEDLPEAYVCCAGSLLGVYLGPVSYPVGKVDKLNLYPMSFTEFLVAVGDEAGAEFIDGVTETTTCSDFMHTHLWEQLKRYFIVGGLPEVVGTYCEYQDDAFTAFSKVREKQRELIDDYFADIAKHAGKVDAMHIHRVWESVPAQLATEQDGSAKKYRFKGVVPGVNRYSKLVSAIDWLDSAGLILKPHIVHHGRQPLSAFKKESSFKLFLFDVGILGALSDLDPKLIWEYDYGSYKGFFAENYIAQALMVAGFTSLYSWQGRTAEVEFLLQIGGKIVPIEVKSGWVTQSKSLRTFAEKYASPYRVIFSAKKLTIDKTNGVHNYPLYLAEKFPL